MIDEIHRLVISATRNINTAIIDDIKAVIPSASRNIIEASSLHRTNVDITILTDNIALTPADIINAITL